MLDYTGIPCPVCHVPFRKEDDIVVCPVCGAPYHRECYQTTGKCLFEETLHQEGKSWEPPVPEEPEKPEPSAEIKDQECPVCGVLNAHSASFCNRCGAPLKQEKQPFTGETPPPFVFNPTSPGSFGGIPFMGDPMGGVSPTETLEDDVTFGDVSKLVKQNTAYYMPVFRYMKLTKRNKFNFTAFLFSGGWMLYRKQYKWGAVVTALMFALLIFYLFSTLFIFAPVLKDLMLQIGADPSVGFELTNEQMLAISALVSQDPILYLKVCLPLICLVCMLVIMFICGFVGNKLYMKHCISTVKSIKTTASISSVSEDVLMETKGGVNIPIAICLFVCYALIMNIPLLL